MKPLTHAELEFKSIPLDLKRFAPETGEFEGYASKFGNEDQGQDVVVKGAFARSLQMRPATKIKMLREHNCADAIGMWLDAAEDDYGLRVKGKLFIEDIQSAREVHTLMKHGQLDGLSIGFRVGKSESGRGSEAVRKLLEVDLREISTVMFPMNEEAVISAVKSGSDLPSEREFEGWLQREAGFSRSEARQIISSGFKSLIKAKQDAGGEQVAKSTQPDAELAAALADEFRRLSGA